LRVSPCRAFNINDLLANGVGAALGFLLLLVFRNTRRNYRFGHDGIKSEF